MSRYLCFTGCQSGDSCTQEEKGNALAAGIRSEGHEAMFLKTDVTDRDILEKNCLMLAAYGKVDILVNCAGGNMPGATISPDRQSSTSVSKISARWWTLTFGTENQ